LRTLEWGVPPVAPELTPAADFRHRMPQPVSYNRAEPCA